MKAFITSDKKSRRATAILCSLFYWLFGMVYLGLFQAPLLSYRSDMLFSGNLSYNPWLGAAVITFIFWLLQRAMLLLVRFGTKSYAFSFLPSFVLLGGITCFPQNYSLPLAVCVFAGALLLSLILFALRGRKSTRLSVVTNLNYSLQELLILSCLTVAIGNTDEDLHHELAMSGAMEKGDYCEVLRIGQNSLSVTPKMADYRIRAMIALRESGNKLFKYPQYYDSLPVLAETVNSGADDAFEREMVRKLLHRDLKGIYEQAGDTAIRQIPAYYAQALVLYSYQHPGISLNGRYENEKARLKDFTDLRTLLKAGHEKPVVEKNKMRREFGTTYWYYYYYSEK